MGDVVKIDFREDAVRTSDTLVEAISGLATEMRKNETAITELAMGSPELRKALRDVFSVSIRISGRATGAIAKRKPPRSTA